MHKHFIHKFAAIFQLLAACCILAILVVVLVSVFLRNVFALGWSATGDLVIYCFAASVTLSALHTLLTGHVVRAGIFYERFSDRAKTGLGRFALLALLFPAMAYAAISTWPMMAASWAQFETSPNADGMPFYFLPKTFLFFMFFTLAIAALVLGLAKNPLKNIGGPTSQKNGSDD